MVTGKIYAEYFQSSSFVWPKSLLCKICFGKHCTVQQESESENDSTRDGQDFDYEPNDEERAPKKPKTEPDLQQLRIDSDALKEVIGKLREKLIGCKSYAEKRQILTLAPSSWTVEKVAMEFGVTEYLVRSTRQQGLPTLSQPPKKKGHSLSDRTTTAIMEFYCSDSVSRLLPGQNSFKAVRNPDGSKSKIQKRLLLMRIGEAYQAFKLEHPNEVIGRSKFASLRPANCILLSKTGYHNVCCCIYHENLKLMYDSIDCFDYKCYLKLLVCDLENKNCAYRRCDCCKLNNVGFLTELKKAVKIEDEDDDDEQIQFKQWGKTDGDYFQVVTMPKNEFIHQLEELSVNLLRHHYLTKKQSQYFKHRKEHLKEGDLLAQCDFAENWEIKHQDEVQSAYFHHKQLTIHPIVVHYKQGGDLKSLSLCVISDDERHNTNAYYVFQSKLVLYLKEHMLSISVSLNSIEYFTDGCAAQYKNFKNFINLFHHKEDFGVEARHTFFATGHGKSACDGLGGAVKRMATLHNLANRQGSNPITSAQEFFDFMVQKQTVEGTKVKYLLILKTEIDAITHKKGLEDRYSKFKTVEGTQRFHHVKRGQGGKILLFYETSYDEHHSVYVDISNSLWDALSMDSFSSGDWVAVTNNDKGHHWYFGQILSLDPENEELEVDFMKEPGDKEGCRTFTRENAKCFVPRDLVLRVVHPPTKVTNRTMAWPERLTAEINLQFGSLA
jgi:hypothetical protein